MVKAHTVKYIYVSCISLPSTQDKDPNIRSSTCARKEQIVSIGHVALTGGSCQ